jgi:hypothetical protein
MPSTDLPNPHAAGVKFGQLPDGHLRGGVIAVTPTATEATAGGRSGW